MDIDQARTFLAIAAHGSFLGAAKRLYVTQSTVSARVQTLETELKARLFVRNRSGATLTPRVGGVGLVGGGRCRRYRWRWAMGDGRWAMGDCCCW